MRIEQMVLGQFATNCYIVSGAETGRAVIVDPADDAPLISKKIGEMGVTPEAVLLTHGHYDHFLAVPDLQKEWKNLPVYCHPLDCPKETEEYDMGQVFPTVTAFSNVKPLSDEQELSVAGLDIKVLHTPGHTPGSVTFLIKDAMFSGDTLFPGSIGRTDFAGGDDAAMMESLKRLGAISENYRVFPGHEGTTNLDYEKKHNPYLKRLIP